MPSVTSVGTVEIDPYGSATIASDAGIECDSTVSSASTAGRDPH